jgi:ribosomal protein L11 methyltransferase
VTEKKPSYWFVAMDVTSEEVDEASARLFELGAEGVEERDEGTLVKGAAGKVTLVASFPTKAKAEAAKKKTKGSRLEELVGDEWRDAWKEHFKPFRLCEGVWVRPPWEEHAPQKNKRSNEKVLVLEPGRAFGTGLHETTRLVAESISMLKRALASTSVLDVGTGSGILALVALALGAKDAIGIDSDPDVIDVATENAARNGMQKKVTFSATPLAKVKGTFGLVLANIEADVLIAMHKQLRAHLAFGGRLVLSGILATRESDVRATFGKPITRASLGEWVALVYA